MRGDTGFKLSSANWGQLELALCVLEGAVVNVVVPTKVQSP